MYACLQLISPSITVSTNSDLLLCYNELDHHQKHLNGLLDLSLGKENMMNKALEWLKL